MAAWWLKVLGARYDALIVANGTPPKKAVYEALRSRCEHVVALDGGLRAFREWRAAPEHVIGDLDSIRRSDFRWASLHGARVHPMPSQEQSDVEKGFSYCRLKQWKHVVMLGVDGDRLDHVLNSLSAASATKGLSITLITQQTLLFVLQGKTEHRLGVPKQHAISWFGFPEARGCTLEGVKWPLKRKTLRVGGMCSLSNQPVAKTVRASQASGTSLLIASLGPKPAKRLLFSR